jgi:hypothetical protein
VNEGTKAAQLLVPRRDLKTAAISDEFFDESDGEGRPATDEPEGEESCRHIPYGP